MTRRNSDGKEYNEQQEELATLAESIGWVVDDSGLGHDGLKFTHGNFVVWATTYGRPHWRKCEYINGYAANHQSYVTCAEALKSGYEPDATLGLGHHGIAIGDRVKWRSDLIPNPNPSGNGDRWLDVISEGVALYAFGEDGRFIHVQPDDGDSTNIMAMDLR